MRLNRFLAAAGLGSRRSVESLIRLGRVRINGRTAELGTPVDPDHDRVTLDGRPVVLPERFTYVLLHKPPGFTVTRTDRHARRTVYELLPAQHRHLAHVGRLDRDSEGLLLFTDDGILGQALLRPESGVRREYVVRTDRDVHARDLVRLKRAIELEPGVRTRVLEVAFRPRRTGGGDLLIVLAEGKKREIRRLCKAVGVSVLRLRRLSFGPIRLGRLAPGAWRTLSRAEVIGLRQAAAAKS